MSGRLLLDGFSSWGLEEIDKKFEFVGELSIGRRKKRYKHQTTSQLTPTQPAILLNPTNSTLIPMSNPAPTRLPAPRKPLPCMSSSSDPNTDDGSRFAKDVLCPSKIHSKAAATLATSTSPNATESLRTDHEVTNSRPSGCSILRTRSGPESLLSAGCSGDNIDNCLDSAAASRCAQCTNANRDLPIAGRR
jgi:hypothetical protein